ncbi:Major Facilitator Superfamily protein [Pirellulimonas nuda]|uniref:Major Facilitator Superfamily protein n=1 Tax=Pirellulimonas nuda TaxID=2528009 RepID=A0A518DDZ2_9BACT|nr:MFS transporter [Pirellulimonas nuda]QDU89699.1 Major Facilitator Superfamily protein [Pirellulimonas nuda]
MKPSRVANPQPTPAAPQAVADPPYAWVMLPLAVLMQIGTSPGQTFGVALFNEPIRESLGLSHTQLTGSYLVASLLASVPLMWIGRRMDRHGMRMASLALVAAVGLSCLAISRVQGVVGLTVGFFLLRAFGQGGLSLAAGNTLGMWFQKRLGVASGIAGVGMSASIAVVPMGYYALIQWLGWRDAYAAVGLILFATLLPLLACFYRNNAAVAAEAESNQAASPRPGSLSFAQAVRTPAYWVASMCSALVGMICTAVFFNLVPLFQHNGFSPAQAAGVFPTVALAMAVMQLNGGVLADRLPLRLLMAVAVATLGGGALAIGAAKSVAAAQVGAALLGAGQGLMAVTGNTLWPRYFGRRELGAIRSSVWTATVAACSAGPFVMGATFDLTGGYGPSLWLFAAMAAVAAAASLAWGGPPHAAPARVTRCSDPALAVK